MESLTPRTQALFLEHGLQEVAPLLVEQGLMSVQDLSVACISEGDLKDIGVQKLFHRRKLLAWAAKPETAIPSAQVPATGVVVPDLSKSGGTAASRGSLLGQDQPPPVVGKKLFNDDEQALGMTLDDVSNLSAQSSLAEAFGGVAPPKLQGANGSGPSALGVGGGPLGPLKLAGKLQDVGEDDEDDGASSDDGFVIAKKPSGPSLHNTGSSGRPAPSRKTGGDHLRVEIFGVRAATQLDWGSGVATPGSLGGSLLSSSTNGGTSPASPPATPQVKQLDPSRHYYMKTFLCDYSGADEVEAWEKTICRTPEMPLNVTEQQELSTSSPPNINTSSSANSGGGVLPTTTSVNSSANTGHHSNNDDDDDPLGVLDLTKPQRSPPPQLVVETPAQNKHNRGGSFSSPSSTTAGAALKNSFISFRTGDTTYDEVTGADVQPNGYVAELKTNFQVGEDADEVDDHNQKPKGGDTHFVAIELKEVHSIGDNRVVCTTVLPLTAFLHFDQHSVREEWLPMYRLKAVKKGSGVAHLPVAFVHAAISVPGGVPKYRAPALHVAGVDMSRRLLKLKIVSATIRATATSVSSPGPADSQKEYFSEPPRSYVSLTVLHQPAGAGSELVPLVKDKTHTTNTGSFAPRFGGRKDNNSLFEFTDEVSLCKLMLIKVKAVLPGIISDSTETVGLVRIPLQFYLTSQETVVEEEKQLPVLDEKDTSTVRGSLCIRIGVDVREE